MAPYSIILKVSEGFHEAICRVPQRILALPTAGVFTRLARVFSLGKSLILGFPVAAAQGEEGSTRIRWRTLGTDSEEEMVEKSPLLC